MSNFFIHTSATSRAGKRFEPLQERDLYPGAIEAARSLPGAAAGVRVIPEMPGPLGVPDFVAIVGGEAAMTNRLQSQIPPILSELDCVLISKLFVRRPRPVESLAKDLSWSIETVEVRLARLRTLGAVTEVKSRRFIRHASLEPHGTIYAIETKVRDWPRALKQARGYRTWAHNYVVVLGPLGYKALNSVSETVKREKGGLYINGQWLVRPTQRKPEAYKRFWGFEHLIAAVQSDQPSDLVKSSTPSCKDSTHCLPPRTDPEIS